MIIPRGGDNYAGIDFDVTTKSLANISSIKIKI
jgi:hypothetical protein